MDLEFWDWSSCSRSCSNVMLFRLRGISSMLGFLADLLSSILVFYYSTFKLMMGTTCLSKYFHLFPFVGENSETFYFSHNF